jgi:RimJ/RimL family protein N-acetyltransferase
VDTNIGSLRSNEKSGAVKEGIIREAEYINGVYHDSIMYSILKKDFDKRAYKDII